RLVALHPGSEAEIRDALFGTVADHSFQQHNAGRERVPFGCANGKQHEIYMTAVTQCDVGRDGLAIAVEGESPYPPLRPGVAQQLPIELSDFGALKRIITLHRSEPGPALRNEDLVDGLGLLRTRCQPDLDIALFLQPPELPPRMTVAEFVRGRIHPVK